MIAIILTILLVVSISLHGASYMAGRKSGKRDGIAIGWLQYRDEQIARDKARRDRIGRFRAKGAK